MRRKRQFIQAAQDEETDLTPLIDVVFVVLILFILVAPMVEIDKVKLASAPNREVIETIVPGELAIHVHEDNTIWINKQMISPEKLKPLLLSLHTKNAKLTPQLYQDRKAAFGTYQLVKNAIEEAGFEELDVVLKPSIN